MKHVARRTRALLSAAGVLAVSACSDSSTGPKPNSSMTPQEALAVASAMMAEIAKASPASAAVRNVVPASASFSAMPTTTVTLNSDCSNGGKISGSATVTNNVNTAGTGSVSAVLTVAPQACKVSNGTKLITVGGQLTFDFSLNLNQNTVVGDIVWHGKGNLTWDDGNCNIDYTVTASPTTGHGSVTGTFCGATLNSTV